MPPRGESGFTLIELLVALAVFSLGVLALLNVTGESTRTAAALEARAFAAVVADNRAVEAVAAERLPVGVAGGVEAAGGRPWTWTRRVTPTPDPALVRVDVTVSAVGDARTLADVTLFRTR